MALAKVAPDKRHLLTPQADPYFILGVTYQGYFDRAWRMWGSDWFDVELIARDFRKAQTTGFNTIRITIDAILAQELEQDQFKKLDQLVELAAQHELGMIVTLNGRHALDLAAVGQLDSKIATHYQDNPTIVAFDLEDEPLFYHLAAATYPNGIKPALQTSQLIDQYGIQVERDQVIKRQQQRHLPSHLDEETTFYYANAVQIFRAYNQAVQNFTAQGNGTIFDYLISDEAAHWHPLISALEQTVESWLTTRLEPIRATRTEQLLTVSWNWLPFALLPANRQLDFQSYHHFTPLTMLGFNTQLEHLSSLRRAFPDHPVLLSEFGWSNLTVTDEPVDSELTALYEAALFSYLRGDGFAGGCKATLNDIIDTSGQEAQLGVFAVGDEAKPISNLVQQFAQHWPQVDKPAVFFSALRDMDSGLTYRFDFADQITVGGKTYQDNAISWKADNIAAHCFIQRDWEQLFIEAQGAGQLSIDPWNIVPIWNKACEADIYRVYSETAYTRQEIVAPGETIVLDVRPGAKYMVKMGLEPGLIIEGTPQVEPKAGEHVLLLADADTTLPAALTYIRRFAPDLSFAPEEVAGRWPYVTVVAAPEQISDEFLDELQSLGTLMVERLHGETPQATQALLDELASRGRRFQTPVPLLKQPIVATNGIDETYTVQPGDSLSKIAQQLYGNFQQWHTLYEANQDQLVSPSRLRAGMELRLPK